VPVELFEVQKNRTWFPPKQGSKANLFPFHLLLPDSLKYIGLFFLETGYERNE